MINHTHFGPRVIPRSVTIDRYPPKNLFNIASWQSLIRESPVMTIFAQKSLPIAIDLAWQASKHQATEYAAQRSQRVQISLFVGHDQSHLTSFLGYSVNTPADKDYMHYIWIAIVAQKEDFVIKRLFSGR